MPKVVDHERFRLDLLERSFDVFARYGYAALGMRTLATHLGVSTGTLYHYFDTKQELFEAMFKYMAHRDVEDGIKAVSVVPSGPLRVQALLSFVHGNLTYFQNVVIVAIDFHRSQDEQKRARRFLVEMVGVYRSAIGEHVGVADKQGEAFLLSLILGSSIQLLFDPESPSLEPQLQFAIGGVESSLKT